jgi:hypothetical protein
MITIPRILLRLIPIAGILVLAGCPSMTGAIGGAGTPLNAVREGTSDKRAGSEDSYTPPPDAAVPPPAAVVPPPAAGGGDSGGLGGAGSGDTEYSSMMRRTDGSSTGGSSTDTPTSGPLAYRDSGGGILTSPSTREPIGSDATNLRVIYFPSSEHRNWTSADDFFAKLSSGQIPEELASKAKLSHAVIMLIPPADGDPPFMVARKEDVLTNNFVTEPGYYLFFMTSDELLWKMGPHNADVTSVAQLKSLVQADQQDDQGRPFRITFLGERTIVPTIDVNLLHQLILPENIPVNPILRDYHLPTLPPIR